MPFESKPSQKKNIYFGEDMKAKKKRILKQSKPNNLVSGEEMSNRQHCVKRIVSYFRSVIEHKIYKITFGIFIILTCIALTSTHPHVDPNSEEAKPYIIMNIVSKSFFILDLFLNLMIYGLFQ